jgi:hypothetical protein
MTWACEAYGDDGLAVGALCFLTAESGARVCTSRAACSEAMAGERRRVFRAINERAATGDEVAAMLAEEFPGPDSLLNAED